MQISNSAQMQIGPLMSSQCLEATAGQEHVSEHREDRHHSRQPHLIKAAAGTGSSVGGHRLRDVAGLGIQDVNPNQAGAQPKVLKIIPDDGGQVLIVLAIAVAIQVGAVLTSATISQGLALQLLWDSAWQLSADSHQDHSTLCEVPSDNWQQKAPQPGATAALLRDCMNFERVACCASSPCAGLL